MKADDVVILVFVVNSGAVIDVKMSRTDANTTLKCWCDIRKAMNHGGFFRRLLTRIRYSFVSDILTGVAQGDGSNAYMIWGVGFEYIQGIYIREIVPSAQERFIAVQEKLVENMEKEIKRGDEWKENDE